MENSRFSMQVLPTKKERMSLLKQRQSLPMYKSKNEVMKIITENRISIIVGETGSGKSTQVTQFLAESPFALHGRICCTQPRSIAAQSLADRVSKEFGCLLGKEVGYTVRFDNFTSEETIIQYVTDGVLLRMCMSDPDLEKYSVVLLDEAHERTVHTDILFALLKQVVHRRPKFKLVVTSATLDATKFSKYFFDAPILHVSGRTFPVEILYAKDTRNNYLSDTLDKIMEIHARGEPGDILVFLPGQKEINRTCKDLKERVKSLNLNQSELLILPMYSALPINRKEQVFEKTPLGSRKVVIATNIAETSITIDGIFYVIDAGYMKRMVYDPKTDLNSLDLTLISQAQAKQRSGRAGRTGPGKCYRLYTEQEFVKKMLPTPIPVIKCNNIITEILQLKVIGYDDFLKFDFMDAPPEENIVAALEELQALSALDKNKKLTPLGKLMAKFPMKPDLSKTLIESIALGCSYDIVTIVSLMSVGSIYYRPKTKEETDLVDHPEGDPMMYLEIFNEWEENDFSYDWCYKNNIILDNLKQGVKVINQLTRIMERHKLPLTSCEDDTDSIGEALFSGFFLNVAKRNSKGNYITQRGKQIVCIHPSSVLCEIKPDWVMYNYLLKTTQKYMCGVMTCNPEWLYNTKGKEMCSNDISDSEDDIQEQGLEDLNTLIKNVQLLTLANKTNKKLDI